MKLGLQDDGCIVLGMQKLANERGMLVFWLPPKKWYHFWMEPRIRVIHLCPHCDDWDECPECCH